MTTAPDKRFEDIRPYNDSEIPAAMQRLAANPLLDQVSAWLFPERPGETFRNMLRSVKTNSELLHQVMYPVVMSIIEKTTAGYTWEGESNIFADRGTLYISNHRDIVMDATLHQLILYKNNFPPGEISFGSNLMEFPILLDLGKSNKMYKVFRKSENMRQLVKNSRHLSDYMRDRISGGRSLWIAQHDGRSKNGIDKTDPGLLKMLSMSDKNDLIRALSSLNITPVAVSYEIEPCDILKVKESWQKIKDGRYVKAPGEDLVSIVTGITQYKGRVHTTLCPPVTEKDLVPYAGLSPSAFFNTLAGLIDNRIYRGYKLYGINYAAYDLITGRKEYGDYYTADDQKLLAQRELLLPQENREILASMTAMLRELYANPVKNKIKYGS
ncbi:MAG TPA: acyltransferase [Bacteroidales bacterium]|nr:acyltransferase [Bacteroidales bacterium]HRW94235.1 acyltransferase [Bacteroidales bacterium]